MGGRKTPTAWRNNAVDSKTDNVLLRAIFRGGAVLFELQPKRAIVNDLNRDLISVYEVIRDDVDALIESLKHHENSEDYFYKIRNKDRNKETYSLLSDVEKASRLVYLNKTCFNGLYRVNSHGEFNVPYGRYTNPNIVNEAALRAVSRYLNSGNITFHSEDFAKTLKRVRKGCFVYLDPPYDPVSTVANFTGYSRDGFGREDQIRLKQCCDELTRRGVKFLLSNSATDFIKDLYCNYQIRIVNAKRAINADASKRGNVEEVLVTNYEQD